MAQTINEVMTHDPITVEAGTSIAQVARKMREGDTGAILITQDGKLAGIITDRDIVVRAIADGRDPETSVGDIATRDPRTVTPDQPVDAAISIMREDDVRRVPVLQDGRAVGIVSLGDAAIERDSDSALADISSGSQNN
jgi:signal-transduction protein with cAMP-binding, CBS, and nucleotidyltransferase domain